MSESAFWRSVVEIRANGTINDYNAAFRFDLFTTPVPDLDAVHTLRLRLQHRADCCVVRGAILDPARTRDVRRLAYPDNRTGDQPTMRESPHQWVALDMDGIERPDTVPPDDLLRCGAEAVRCLPFAFREARSIIQATGSHGIRPGIRARVWYWLNRPTTGAELMQWLRETPTDASVFRTVQPIYTAAPDFETGIRDHLPRRMVELPGAEIVNVPPLDSLRPSPHRPGPPLPRSTDTGASRYAFAALRDATMRVAVAAVNTRHATLLREARSLVRFISSGLLTEQDVRRCLFAAAEQAGKTGDESAKNASVPTPTSILSRPCARTARPNSASSTRSAARKTSNGAAISTGWRARSPA